MLPSLLAQATEPSILDVGGILLSAFSGGQYALLGAAALLLVVLAARKGGAKVLPWLGTPRGGAVLSLALVGLTTLVARLSSGAAFSLGLVLEAVSAAVMTSGLWSTGKALVEKKAQPAPSVATVCTPREIAAGTCKP